MDKFERIQNVEEAAHLIQEAIGLIVEAVKDTPEEGMTMSYTVGHLKTWVGQGNPYDHHTDKIIEGLNEWDELPKGYQFCPICERDHPDEDMWDEDCCVKCWEDKPKDNDK